MTKKRIRQSTKVEEAIVSFLPSKRSAVDSDKICFLGEPIPANEAQSKWPHRYSNNE